MSAIAPDLPAQHRLGNILAAHLAAADVLGRAQILRTVKRKTGRVVEIGQYSSRRAEFEDSDPIQFDTDLPNEDIAAYLRSLTPVTREVFDGLTSLYRKDAFTIAGIEDVRLIKKIQDELVQVADRGGDAQDFDRAVNRMLSDAGVQQLNAFTLDTAFNTAMQRAFSRGRYDQMKDPAVKALLPIWQYWTVGDSRVRPEHRVLHDFAAHADDPVWLKIYPPNGFNCRCSVVPILLSEAPKDANEPGMLRLPMLARLKVPQPGFGKVFAF